MDYEEYCERILGEGTQINLSINSQEPDEEAVVIMTVRKPPVTVLKRLKNELENKTSTEINNNIYPLYLKIKGLDVLAIGKLDLTIKKVHHILGILDSYSPAFYRVHNGNIGESIKPIDLVKTIKLTGVKSINEFI